jgi:hypothetical protein
MIKFIKKSVNAGWWDNVLMIVLIPFMIFDFVFALVVMLSLSFSIIPFYINLFLFAPLIYFIMLDYVIPLIRGN